MLPRLRSSAKKAIGLLERSVSSSKHSLKETNETPGYVRNQHKVELPPDAKATPAVMPKPPSPSTGAASFAAFFSSSSSSSWQFHSIPRDVRLLGAGALGALGAGALLFSLSGNADGKGEAGRPFFNRLTEQAEFKKKFNGPPAAITVLVGPPSCGKSRFLQELAGKFEVDKTAPPFLYIDSRLTPVRTPEELSKALSGAVNAGKRQQLKKYSGSDLWSWSLNSLSFTIGVFTISVEALLSKVSKGGSLEVAIERATEFFESLSSLPRKPVLVIDEANMLMDWTEPGPAQPQLKKLLAHLVSISKQNNLAHVYLATSDDFLAKWLAGKGLGPGNFIKEVLGDLTEEEAREFFRGDGVKETWAGIINDSFSPEPVPAGAEEKWPAIYERCGGNIGMLQQCVIEARAKGNWDDALDTVVANSRSAIEQGFTPGIIPKRDELPKWIGKQWQTVLERITTAPHHAVLQKEIVRDLGKGDDESGKKILLSMVKYDLLSLRPYSTLARDLPREVYGDDEEEVVTLPSPGHVWAAKRILLRRKSDADTKPRTWLKSNG